MQIKPLFDKIAVVRHEVKDETPAGIFLLPTLVEKPGEGTVFAVGSGKIMPNGSVRPMSLEVGDKVLFNQKGGQEMKVEGITFLIMREEDIYGKVE